MAALMAKWLDVFGEPPVLADAELMAALLAERSEQGGRTMNDRGYNGGEGPRPA